jgi:hypothetical protein
VKPTSPRSELKPVLAVLAAAVVLLVALFPVARHVDETTDRQRPMYEDLARVEWLQYQAMQSTGSAVPLDVEDGETVTIGEAEFRASPGVRVVVEVPGPDQFCAVVSNRFGDESARSCFDPEAPPSDPGGAATFVAAG